MRGRAVGALVLAASLLAGSGARAADEVGAPCPPPAAPWLRVAMEGDGFEPTLRAGVMRQMDADLSGHGVAACPSPGVGEPLADVTLSLTRARGLSVELRDEVTHKRLSRELSLASVPRDALALSIALAAEELLHASWIEAALVPPPSPAPQPVAPPLPPAVIATNDATLVRLPRRYTTQAAVLASVEHSAGGQTDAGADVRVAWGGRLAVGARFGFRAAADVTSAHGTVRGREVLAGVAASYAVVPRSAPWGGEVVVRADVLDVQLSADAAAGARASSGSALGVLASVGLGGWASLGAPWRLVAEATAGAPLHAVTASDAGSVATGVSGVVLGVALGVGASL